MDDQPRLQRRPLRQHLVTDRLGAAARFRQCCALALAGRADAAADDADAGALPARDQRAALAAGGQTSARLHDFRLLDRVLRQSVHFGLQPVPELACPRYGNDGLSTAAFRTNHFDVGSGLAAANLN